MKELKQMIRRFLSQAVLLSLFVFLVAPVSTAMAAPKEVRVGATEFPPYIVIERDGSVAGILIETLNYLNAIQTKYKFVAISYSAMRRHNGFKNKVFDISFFDNIEWGWDKSAVDVSDIFMRGKEIYIALAKPGRGEEYFADLKSRTMIGVLGYHYSFADFNSDPAFLRKNYRMQLTSSNEGSIAMVLDGRGDVAVVSDAFLNWYLQKNPTDKKLLVSKKVDQHYLHTVIVRKGISPTVHEINALLKQFRKSKVYEDILIKYGVNR
jgi:polar amino acid transport system substrate-binding protein